MSDTTGGMKECSSCGEQMVKRKKYKVTKTHHGLPDGGKPVFRSPDGHTWKCYNCGRQEDA